MSARIFTLEPPEHLSTAVAAEWQRSVPAILRAYRVEASDVGSLERYCSAMVTMRQAERLVEEYGLVSEAGRSTAAARALRDATALAERVLRRLTPEAGLGGAPIGALQEVLYRIGILERDPESSDEVRNFAEAYLADHPGLLPC